MSTYSSVKPFVLVATNVHLTLRHLNLTIKRVGFDFKNYLILFLALS